MKNISKIFLIFILILSAISCGLPDVTGITLELNQPYITKIIPGDNQLTVEFEAQNNEPSFSGYNIYFGDSTDPRKYKLYSPQKYLPTITEKPFTTVKKYSYTIKIGDYYSTGGSEIDTLTSYELNNGIPIYVWVSSYQITPQLESYYYYDNFVKMGTPRPEILNRTVNAGETIDGTGRAIATLVLSGTQLVFRNVANGSMMRVSGSSLTDIVVPPENGYGTADLQVLAGRLYLIKITEGGNSYYGKIYVRSVNGTSSAVIDYCHQPSANILSY